MTEYVYKIVFRGIPATYDDYRLRRNRLSTQSIHFWASLQSDLRLAPPQFGENRAIFEVYAHLSLSVT
jgi:hypothetical protein